MDRRSLYVHPALDPFDLHSHASQPTTTRATLRRPTSPRLSGRALPRSAALCSLAQAFSMPASVPPNSSCASTSRRATSSAHSRTYPTPPTCPPNLDTDMPSALLTRSQPERAKVNVIPVGRRSHKHPTSSIPCISAFVSSVPPVHQECTTCIPLSLCVY